MLKCRACGKSSSRVKFDGYHIRVEGVAELDESGSVAAVSPLVVKACVKPGQEISGKNVSVTCPHCGNSAHISAYDRVFKCILTGRVADMEVRIDPPIGVIKIDAGAEALAQQVFSRENLREDNSAESALNFNAMLGRQ